MKITVKLFATLRIGRFKQEDRDYPDGLTCQEIANDLGIKADEVGIILVNGRHASLKHVLSDGDALSLLAMVGGG